MLRIKIVVVDRTHSGFLKQGEDFYLKRLKRYAQVEWVEVKPTPIKKGRQEEEILTLEGQAIDKALLPREYLIALDRLGDNYDSEGLAAKVEQLTLSQSRLTFVIGGPLGLSREIVSRADEVLALSKLTLTHEMSRLVLLEQLYRAFTIIRGEKYHK